jgi:hypothetical protein
MSKLRLRVVAHGQSAYRISGADCATVGHIAVDRSRTGEHARMMHSCIAVDGASDVQNSTVDIGVACVGVGP